MIYLHHHTPSLLTFSYCRQVSFLFVRQDMNYKYEYIVVLRASAGVVIIMKSLFMQAKLVRIDKIRNSQLHVPTFCWYWPGSSILCELASQIKSPAETRLLPRSNVTDKDSPPSILQLQPESYDYLRAVLSFKTIFFISLAAPVSKIPIVHPTWQTTPTHPIPARPLCLLVSIIYRIHLRIIY